LYQYFPKLCPQLRLEINFYGPRTTPDVTMYTLAEVEQIAGQEGNYQVTSRSSRALSMIMHWL
jgi:quinone-modifying oxidoreductase subunit QmoA